MRELRRMKKVRWKKRGKEDEKGEKGKYIPGT